MNQDSISLWRERIADRTASGISTKEWCKQHRITKGAYYYWHRKISDLDGNLPTPPLFVEIPAEQELPQKSSTGTLRIEWKELAIQVTDIYSVSLAAELLKQLQKTC